MRQIILYTIVLVLLQACNLPRFIENKNTKHLIKSGFNEQYLKLDNHVLHYYNTNINKPNTLVFIHGFSGSANLQWTKTAIPFSKDYNIVLPDLLYHGKSTSNSENYSVELQCQSIKKILDTLNIKTNVILIGNSYGGLVASVFFANYPSYCNRLILNDPMHSETNFSAADSLAVSVGKKNALNLLLPSDAKGLKTLLNAAMYKSIWVPAPIAKQFVNTLFINKIIAFEKVMNHVIDNSILYKKMDLHLDTNTYFIWGKNDRLIPYQSAYPLLKRYQLNPSQLFLIDKSGHVPNMEKPKAFQKILEQILNLKKD